MIENRPTEFSGMKLLWVNDEWSFTIDRNNITLRQWMGYKYGDKRDFSHSPRYYSNWREALWGLIDRGILYCEYDNLKDVVDGMNKMRDEVREFANTLPTKEELSSFSAKTP